MEASRNTHDSGLSVEKRTTVDDTALGSLTVDEALPSQGVEGHRALEKRLLFVLAEEISLFWEESISKRVYSTRCCSCV